MSSWCPACYQNSCPEAPAITINQTTVEMDGSVITPQDDYFSYDAVTAANNIYLQLTGVPIAQKVVTVYRNAQVQRLTTDYTISGGVVTLLQPLTADEQVKVTYWANLEAADAYALSGIGSVIGTAAAINVAAQPNHGLWADGVTKHSWAAYGEFYTWAAANTAAALSLLESPETIPETATGNFILKLIQPTASVGGVFQAMNGYVIVST